MKQLTRVLAAAVTGLVLTAIASGQTTHVKPLYGKVVSVDAAAGKLVISTGTENAHQVTVATNASTKVVVSDKPATLADIKAGMYVRVVPPTGTATEIRAFVPKPTTPPGPTTKPVYGKVVSVDAAAGKVVITTGTDNAHQVTVATNASTKIVVSDKPATLADIKAGMMVRVVPPTGTATEIRAFVPKPTTK